MQGLGSLPRPTESKSLWVGLKSALRCPRLPALSLFSQGPLPLRSTRNKTSHSPRSGPDASPVMNLHDTYFFSLRQIHCPSFCLYHLQNTYHSVLFCLVLWMFIECYQILCQGQKKRRNSSLPQGTIIVNYAYDHFACLSLTNLNIDFNCSSTHLMFTDFSSGKYWHYQEMKQRYSHNWYDLGLTFNLTCMPVFGAL